jgi:hypothetical protein
MSSGVRPLGELSGVAWRRELVAAGLDALQQERAVLAAEEAEYILEFAG